MKKLDLEYWRRAVGRLRDVFTEREEELCGYDAAFGDGDHGTSMVRGFREAVDRLEKTEITDIGTLFQTVGHAFIGSVGGVTGIIFGTMFLHAGKSADGKTALTVKDLSQSLSGSLEAVLKGGKVQEGKKSMVDALAPAVRAVEDAASKDITPEEALEAAHRAARKGMDATAAMEAGVGRGRYQTDRGVGHIDAGAVSVAVIFEVLGAECSRL